MLLIYSCVQLRYVRYFNIGNYLAFYHPGGSSNLTRKLNLKPIFCEIFDKSARVNFPYSADTTSKLSSLIRRRMETNFLFTELTLIEIFFALCSCHFNKIPSFDSKPLIIFNQKFLAHRLKSNSVAGVIWGSVWNVIFAQL